jgi:hypothetical protein
MNHIEKIFTHFGKPISILDEEMPILYKEEAKTFSDPPITSSPNERKLHFID